MAGCCGGVPAKRHRKTEGLHPIESVAGDAKFVDEVLMVEEALVLWCFVHLTAVI